MSEKKWFMQNIKEVVQDLETNISKGLTRWAGISKKRTIWLQWAKSC